MVLTPWFVAVNTIVYWGLPCVEDLPPTILQPKKPFEKFLRATVED